MEPKAGSLKKINKTDKPLVRLIKKKSGGGSKSIKVGMKKVRLQPPPQKYKGL